MATTAGVFFFFSCNTLHFSLSFIRVQNLNEPANHIRPQHAPLDKVVTSQPHFTSHSGQLGVDVIKLAWQHEKFINGIQCVLVQDCNLKAFS